MLRELDFSNLGQSLITILTSVVIVLIALTFHEAAHGWMAHKCGDDTVFQLMGNAIDVLAHLPDIVALKFRRVITVPLCEQRPFLFFVGAVQRHNKIFAVTLPGQRFKPHIVVQRADHGTVVLEPDVIVVQNERV